MSDRGTTSDRDEPFLARLMREYGADDERSPDISLLRLIVAECGAKPVRLYLNAKRGSRGRPPGKTNSIKSEAARWHLDDLANSFGADGILEVLSRLPSRQRGRPRKLKAIDVLADHVDCLANSHFEKGSSSPMKDAFAECHRLEEFEGRGRNEKSLCDNLKKSRIAMAARDNSMLQRFIEITAALSARGTDQVAAQQQATDDLADYWGITPYMVTLRLDRARRRVKKSTSRKK